MTGQEKWDSCQHRSLNPMNLGSKKCCGGQVIKGYVCLERNIDNVTPAKCRNCDIFIEKRTLMPIIGQDDPFDFNHASQDPNKKDHTDEKRSEERD